MCEVFGGLAGGVLALAPLLELGAGGGEGGLVEAAGEFGVELGDNFFGIGEPSGANGGFEEAEERLIAVIGLLIGGAGEPALGLGEVIGAEVELSDGQLLGGARLNVFGGEVGFEGFVTVT